MRRGFRQVYGWNDSDIAEAEKRVLMLNPKGKMGKDFIAYLRRVQRKYHFDLVVINPLQGVAGIDLSQNKEPLTAGQLRDLARTRFNRKKGDEAYEHLVKNTEKFGLNVQKQRGSNIKLYSAGVLPL